ncbi:MAG TPA: DMT family transporter [Nevskiaceae bacterium]|nr:DMT family transporter [Nevskiaceae bacterium]
MTKARKTAYAALLTTAVIWGFAPPIIKYTLGFIDPVSFLFYRFLVAGLLLALPLFLKLKKTKFSLKKTGKYLALGFLGTPLTLILLFIGIQKTTAIDASIIWIISPILVVLGGAFFLKENVTKIEKIGIGLTLMGTLITIFQPLLESGVNFGGNIWGNALVFGGTCVWAGFTLLTKKEKSLDPFILSSSSFLVGALVMFPFFLTRPVLTVPKPAIFGILYMALLGSMVAYFTYIYGLAKIEASEATIFTYLQPLFAVPLAAVWLAEKITLLFLIGALLIGLGVFICEKR